MQFYGNDSYELSKGKKLEVVVRDDTHIKFLNVESPRLEVHTISEFDTINGLVRITSMMNCKTGNSGKILHIKYDYPTYVKDQSLQHSAGLAECLEKILQYPTWSKYSIYYFTNNKPIFTLMTNFIPIINSLKRSVDKSKVRDYIRKTNMKLVGIDHETLANMNKVFNIASQLEGDIGSQFQLDFPLKLPNNPNTLTKTNKYGEVTKLFS